MGWLLPLVFVGVPALEIALLVKVGGAVGAGWTFLVVIATGLAGATLAKRQGLQALADVQQAMASGRRVGATVVSALLLLVAGVLLITPGFVTDAVGFGLLIPPARTWVARRVANRLGSRIHVIPMGMDHSPPPPGVIDV